MRIIRFIALLSALISSKAQAECGKSRFHACDWLIVNDHGFLLVERYSSQLINYRTQQKMTNPVHMTYL